MLSKRSPSRGHAFTLIELVAVIVVLGVLSAIAIPKYLNYKAAANQNADTASVAAVNSALKQRYMLNRSTDAASSSWITSASQVAGVMETGQLPDGITLSGTTFTDRRGNTYTLTAETQTDGARLAVSGSSGSGGSGGSSGGAASIPVPGLLMALTPWLRRPRRATTVS